MVHKVMFSAFLTTFQITFYHAPQKKKICLNKISTHIFATNVQKSIEIRGDDCLDCKCAGWMLNGNVFNLLQHKTLC